MMKPQELAYLDIAYNSTLNPLVQKYNENLKIKYLMKTKPQFLFNRL